MGCHHRDDSPVCYDCLRDQSVFADGCHCENQFGASNLQAQIGNYGNFIAYLLMGIPAGMLLKKWAISARPLIA